MPNTHGEVVKVPRPSYSSLTLHRKCPQAWTYKHLRGLRAVETELPTERLIGSWWHALRAADSVKRGTALDSLRELPDEIRTCDGGPTLTRIPDTRRYRLPTRDQREVPLSGDVITALAAAWWRTLPREATDQWLEKYGKTLAEHLSWLDSRWHDRWDEDLRNEAPVAVELKWVKKLVDEAPEMVGYVDEVYEDTARRLVVARDHKTSGSLDAADSQDDLMDSQLHLYAWGAEPRVRELIGKPIHAVAYDRVRVKLPKSPQVTRGGTLSKSVTDYDLRTYREWAESGVEYPGTRKDGSRAGTYQIEEKVVEKLSTPAARSVWQQRSLMPLNRNVVNAHVTEARNTARAAIRTISEVEESGQAPRNFTRRGCQWCEYNSLCRAELMGGPDGDYPLEDHKLVQLH